MTHVAAFCFIAFVHLSLGTKIWLAFAGAGLLGTTIAAKTPGPLVAATSPDYDTVVGQSSNLPFQFEVLTGTTDVITGGGGSLGSSVPICGTSFLETAGVNAATLATPATGSPAAGGNDGLEITIVDNSGHAHTVTTASNIITPSHHVATFNGTQGSFVTFVARNGKWIPVQLSGVTLS